MHSLGPGNVSHLSSQRMEKQAEDGAPEASWPCLVRVVEEGPEIAVLGLAQEPSSEELGSRSRDGSYP